MTLTMAITGYGDGTGFDGFLNGLVLYENDFFSLPEEIQEQVNAHANEFHSHAEMSAYIRDLLRRA
jgi:hypothetical protein